MPLAAIHRERFKEDLDKMPLDELVKLEVDTREKRDLSNARFVSQLAAVIPSRGTSLFSTAVWYGPRSGYYEYKYRLVRSAIQKRGLVVSSLPFRDVAIPPAGGPVNVAHGGGADRFKHLLDGTEFAQSQNAQQLALGGIEWLGRLFNAAGSTIENRSPAVQHPSIAPELPSEGDSNASNGRDPGNRQLVADRLDGLFGTTTRGGEPLISTKSAEMLGSVAPGVAVGGVAGKRVERVHSDSGTAPNEAGLASKIWMDGRTGQESSRTDRRPWRVSVTTIIWVVLIAGLMLPIIHFRLTPRSFNPPSYITNPIGPLLPFTSHPPSWAEYGVNTTADSPRIAFPSISDAYTLT